MKTAFEIIQERLNLVKANLKQKPLTVFQKAEAEGRKLFVPYCYKYKMVPQFHSDDACAYDAWTGEKEFYELKYKQGLYFIGNKYENLISKEGIALECKKYKGLKDLWLKDKSKNYYYWMAYEDKTFIHQIDFNKEYKVIKRSMPNSTVNFTHMEDKSICLIPLKDCTIIDTVK